MGDGARRLSLSVKHSVQGMTFNTDGNAGGDSLDEGQPAASGSRSDGEHAVPVVPLPSNASNGVTSNGVTLNGVTSNGVTPNGITVKVETKIDIKAMATTDGALEDGAMSPATRALELGCK